MADISSNLDDDVQLSRITERDRDRAERVFQETGDYDEDFSDWDITDFVKYDKSSPPSYKDVLREIARDSK